MSEEGLLILMLLFIGVMAIFSIAFYITAGIYIIKDSKAAGNDPTGWAVGHFIGYFFVGTWVLGIYQLVNKKVGWGIFWIGFPFVLSFVLFMFFIVVGASVPV